MANVRITVRGFQRMMRNFNKKVAEWEGPVTMKGLVQAAAVVRNATEKETPKTPVDIGNLRASWLVVTSTGAIRSGGNPNFKESRRRLKGQRPVHKADVARLKAGHASALAYGKGLIIRGGKKFPAVAFGYGAYYAMIVHEMGEGTKWSREGSEPQWFARAIKNNQGKMLAKIQNAVAIKGNKGKTTTK